MEVDRSIEELRAQKRKTKAAMTAWEEYQNSILMERNASAEQKLRRALRKLKVIGGEEPVDVISESVYALSRESKRIPSLMSEQKAMLASLLDQFNGPRTFRSEYLRDKNVISIFESCLTRTLGISTGSLSTDLIVVKTCYFKILKDIILNGFFLNGEKYIYFTASAGQIRTKRSVFIRESQLKRYSDKLMCGLSMKKINAAGGVNTNKYLAYLALCNSATDPWPEFDIAKTIVVDDMETNVTGVVDYIDGATYYIERKKMDVPITHTDGAGMIRLDVSRKNFMIRLPWVKGLLAAFPFDKFIREANRADPHINHGLVRDIYGVEHDILVEDIQIILFKSQFKMHKFYNDWAEYQAYFTTFGCEASICNMEPDVFDDAKINYQMIQTLSDLSDEELWSISEETRRRLDTISTDRSTMLQVFGATKQNPHRSGFQESLLLYPELLQDEYTRDTLREIKKSIISEAVSGRLNINGKYTFLIPDFYAVCQWLFLRDKDPAGLLADGEVWCRLFPDAKDLDCLRSPHLYMEHAVRKNRFDDAAEAKRWFVTDGIYTSCKDLISKILQ